MHCYSHFLSWINSFFSYFPCLTSTGQNKQFEDVALGLKMPSGRNMADIIHSFVMFCRPNNSLIMVKNDYLWSYSSANLLKGKDISQNFCIKYSLCIYLLCIMYLFQNNIVISFIYKIFVNLSHPYFVYKLDYFCSFDRFIV